MDKEIRSAPSFGVGLEATSRSKTSGQARNPINLTPKPSMSLAHVPTLGWLNMIHGDHLNANCSPPLRGEETRDEVKNLGGGSGGVSSVAIVVARSGCQCQNCGDCKIVLAGVVAQVRRVVAWRVVAIVQEIQEGRSKLKNDLFGTKYHYRVFPLTCGNAGLDSKKLGDSRCFKQHVTTHV